MGQVFDGILKRRSIRKYKNQEIPQDKLKKVLEAANWAPSNGNSQPWRFIVTKGEYVDKVCNVFYNWAKDYIPNAPYIPKEQVPGMLKYAENFGGAPVHIIVTHEIFEDEMKTKEALMAASAAIQNLCLAAWEEGLGTVWIGGYVLHAEDTREILQLSENQEIAGIIPIGYPDENPVPPERIDLNQKVEWLGF
ncbi:MAG: nitroreductase family protein [Caldicoprobacterales bacterium]|jgi:nitroreductase